MHLSSEFRFDAFKSRTEYRWRRRGSNMEQVDASLKAYWTAVAATRVPDQLSALIRLVKECNGWMKKKKDKNTAEAGMFKTRWDDIKKLGQASLALAFTLKNSLGDAMDARAKSLMGSQLSYEHNRQRRLGERSAGGAAVVPVTKALGGSYQPERAMFVAGGKKTNPLAMTTIAEVRGMIVEDSISSHDAVAGKFGKSVYLNKPLEALTVGDMHQIDHIMGEIEKMTSALARQVVYLDKSSRMPFIALVSGGKLFHFDGSTPWDVVSCAYAMDEYGNLFLENSSDAIPDRIVTGRHERLNHSTFLAGKDVICAGMMTIRAGKLINITNTSGHYKPTGVNLYQALLEMRGQGVDLAGALVTLTLAGDCGHMTNVESVLHYRGELPITLTSYYTPDKIRAGAEARPDALPGATRPRATGGTPPPRTP